MTNVSPCLSLALAMAMPTLALAGPTGDQPAVAEQRSATDHLESLLVIRAEMEGGDAVAEVLREDVLAALRAAKVAPTLPDGAPLEVVVSSDANTIGAYGVVYRHRGVVLDSWSCTCSGEELRARLGSATPDAWRAAIEAATPAPEPEPAAVASAPREDPGPGMGEPGHGMWIAGVATTAIGTGLAVGPSVLIILRAADGKEIKALPVGVLATGVAMAVTGGVLWGLANRKRKRAYLGVGVGKGVVVTVGGRF